MSPQHRKLPGNCREVRQGRVELGFGGWRVEGERATAGSLKGCWEGVQGCACTCLAWHKLPPQLQFNRFEPGNSTCHIRKVQQGSVCGVVCVCCERALAVVRVRLGGCMLTCGSMRWGCWSRCPARGFQQFLPCLAPRLHLGTACCTAGSGPGPPAVQTIILHSSTCPSTAARAAASCSPSNVMLLRRVLDPWQLIALHPG